MTEPKVIIVVLGADGAYTALVDAVRATWGKSGICEVVYCYGWREGRPRPERGQVFQTGDEVICGCEESLANIHLKTILTFEHLLKTKQFDYLFRCCAGSYVVQKELLKFLADKPQQRFYCGIIGHGLGVWFASGSGYFLSRDLIQLIVDRKAEVLSHKHQDDVALGAFLASKGVPISPTARRCDGRWEPGHYHYHFGHNVSLMNDLHEVIKR